MIPKHKNPTRWEYLRNGRTEKRDAARAPYNFVPLPDMVVKIGQEQLPDHDSYAANHLSGWLDCTLTTSSPIYIRGMVKPDRYGEESKNLPEFFYVDDKNKPVIPGSSLRGLLRNMVEIAGYGKMTEVSKKRLVYRAVAEGEGTSFGRSYNERFMESMGYGEYIQRMRAGYMEKRGDGDWSIRPAMERDGTTFALINSEEFPLNGAKHWRDCKNAYSILVKVGPYKFESLRKNNDSLKIKQARVSDISDNEGGGFFAAVRIISGKMTKKKSDMVAYLPDEKANLLPLGDDLIDAYKDQIRNNTEQINLLGSKDGVLRDGQPVFYLTKEDGSVDFFGHTRFFRLQYSHSPYDLIPEHLKRESDVDLAEALFGYVKGENSRAGRVFITDAHLLPNQNKVAEETIVPRILSSPKPTTFQHYLVQDQPDWVASGNSHTTELHDYSDAQAILRGNKLYWHKGDISLNDIRDSKVKQQDSQHTEIRPLRSGIEFKFKIHFENLAEQELGALLWVLQTAADERYRLKLGMGKPLGMGAVKIEGSLNLIDRSKRYRELFSQDDWAECATSFEFTKFVAAFERYILQGIGNTNAESLSDVERIQMLLKMLSWEDRPDSEDTRYMEIERRDNGEKRNEYRGRPVLPNPNGVGVEAIKKQPERREEAKPVLPKEEKVQAAVVTIAPHNKSIDETTASVQEVLKQRAAEQEEKEERKRIAKLEKNKKKK